MNFKKYYFFNNHSPIKKGNLPTYGIKLKIKQEKKVFIKKFRNLEENDLFCTLKRNKNKITI